MTTRRVDPGRDERPRLDPDPDAEVLVAGPCCGPVREGPCGGSARRDRETEDRERE